MVKYSRFDHALVNLGRVRFYTAYLVRQGLMKEQDALAMCHRFYDRRPELSGLPVLTAIQQAMERREGAYNKVKAKEQDDQSREQAEEGQEETGPKADNPP